MKQKDVDWLLALAQVGFAGLMLMGIFGLVFVLIFFHGAMTSVAVTIITSVITALVTVFTLQMNFFYARQRPAALPDPMSMTLTTGTDPVATATVTNPLVPPQTGVQK